MLFNYPTVKVIDLDKIPFLKRFMELFMIPAIKLPSTVVELRAMAALIIIPRKTQNLSFERFINGQCRTNPELNKNYQKVMVLW